MVLHSDNCCYTYIRPILHAMCQDDMIYRWISGITIWCNTSVAALICIIPLRREPGNLRYTEHKLHVIKQLLLKPHFCFVTA